MLTKKNPRDCGGLVVIDTDFSLRPPFKKGEEISVAGLDPGSAGCVNTTGRSATTDEADGEVHLHLLLLLNQIHTRPGFESP